MLTPKEYEIRHRRELTRARVRKHREKKLRERTGTEPDLSRAALCRGTVPDSTLS
ncbi:MAG: hypothetical protein IKF99_09025 [Oscillospiraceae bacterium]|nr:hypothetical protein [Oscillospiraceae bacterium]